MKPALIIKTGRTLESLRGSGDFEAWIAAGMGLLPDQSRVVNVQDGEPLPDPGEVSGVVVTGSPAMVSDREPWSESTAAWLRSAVDRDIPTLGICYGHQLVAQAFGGEVGLNPRGREIGTSTLELSQAAAQDSLLSGIDPPKFHFSHLEAVLRLPPDATRLASTALDDNSAFSIGSAWGIQFHPEFDATVMRTYLAARSAILAAEGIDSRERAAAVSECPSGPTLLRRFASRLEIPHSKCGETS